MGHPWLVPSGSLEMCWAPLQTQLSLGSGPPPQLHCSPGEVAISSSPEGPYRLQIRSAPFACSECSLKPTVQGVVDLDAATAKLLRAPCLVLGVESSGCPGQSNFQHLSLSLTPWFGAQSPLDLTTNY